MERISQSVAKRVALKAYLSSDHVSAATGKTIAVVISKNGAAFGNPNAGATNATQIANGWYYVDLDTTDTGTAGPLIVRGTEGTIDPTEIAFSVESPIPAVADIADAVWDEALSGHAISGSTGEALDSAGSGGGAPTAADIAEAVWDEDLTGHVAADSAGALLGTAGATTDAVIADKLLGRHIEGGADGGRTVSEAFQALRNKTAIAAGTLTVYESDDSTPAWTAAVTTAAGDPVVSVDPA